MGEQKGLKWEGGGGRNPYFTSDRTFFRPKYAPSRWSSPYTGPYGKKPQRQAGQDGFMR